MHGLSLCLWEDLFGGGLNANTTTASMVSAGAGCPQIFNLYFMFSGALASIIFLVSFRMFVCVCVCACVYVCIHARVSVHHIYMP